MSDRLLTVGALLLVLMLWGAVPTASAPAASAPAAPDRVRPTPVAESKAGPSIPVPEVARQAEEVGKVLRDLDGLITSDATLETMGRRFPETIARIDAQTKATDLELGGPTAPAALERLATQWQTSRAALVDYVNGLAARATMLEGAQRRLAELTETWRRARVDAQASRAPAPVIERIDGVLESIQDTRKRLQEERAATLVLQDRVAQEVTRCERMLQRIAGLWREVAKGLLEPDRELRWHPAQLARVAGDLPALAGSAIAADGVLLQRFVKEQPWRIPIQLLLFLGLALTIRAARRRAPLRAESMEAPGASRVILDRPLSAALVLTALASPLIYTLPLPRAVVVVVEAMALVPALRIAQVALDRPLAPRMYVLGALFVADFIRYAAAAVPLLEQQIFLLEMLGGVLFLAWHRVARRSLAAPAPGRMSTWDRLVGIAADGALLVFAGAFVVGAAGYMSLALLLGAGLIGNGYLALVLYAGVKASGGLVSLALSNWPLRGFRLVAYHRPLLDRRAQGLLRGLAVVAWFTFALTSFGLWGVTVELARRVLGAELRLGAIAISLGDVLVFVLTVAATFLISALLRFTLEEEVYPRLGLGRRIPGVVSSLLHYGLLLVGFLLALAALGVDLTKVTILAGAFGVGIGFGLQNLVNNLVSGGVVLVERKINVGDVLQIGDVAGEVREMGMRSCTLRTWEGAEVIVPNATLVSDRVVNWTLSDQRRRIDVAVAAALGTPPEKVLEILLGVARAHPRILSDPPAVALFQGFQESALRFELRSWTDRFDLWLQTQSELAVAAYAALREAAIEVPLPQREVRFRK